MDFHVKLPRHKLCKLRRTQKIRRELRPGPQIKLISIQNSTSTEKKITSTENLMSTEIQRPYLAKFDMQIKPCDLPCFKVTVELKNAFRKMLCLLNWITIAFVLPRTNRLTGHYQSGDDGVINCVRLFLIFQILLLLRLLACRRSANILFAKLGIDFLSNQ